VEVVPGPSAVTCALVASGIACEHFFFEGFLPRKHAAQRECLSELAAIPGALVVYESPRRVAATLAAVAEVMPARRVALVRELTKVHEEVVRDVAPALAQTVAGRDEIRGECVIVIAPPSSAERDARRQATSDVAGLTLDEAIRRGLAQGEPKTALARHLARSFSLGRAEVYDRVVELAAEG